MSREKRHGLAGKERCVMTWKALEWHGVAGEDANDADCEREERLGED